MRPAAAGWNDRLSLAEYRCASPAWLGFGFGFGSGLRFSIYYIIVVGRLTAENVMA